MRRAYSNFKFIEDESIFIGVSLGYNHCAEHEWGIKGMYRVFGIDTNKMGVDGRTISKNDTVFFIDKNKAILRTDYPYEKIDIQILNQRYLMAFIMIKISHYKLHGMVIVLVLLSLVKKRLKN